MPDDEKGRQPLGDHVSRAVRRYREAQRMPYTELSELLSELGRPIPVVGLRRLERGERRVDVDDLAALAKALGVPPLLLLFPLGRDATVEVLPDRRVDTWRAAKWFTAEGPFTGEETRAADGQVSIAVDEADLEGWNRIGVLGHLYREHENKATEWAVARWHAGTAREQAANATTDAERESLLASAARSERKQQTLEQILRDLRQQIRRLGATSPALPADFPPVDKTEAADTRWMYPSLNVGGHPKEGGE